MYLRNRKYSATDEVGVAPYPSLGPIIFITNGSDFYCEDLINILDILKVL